MYCIFQIIKSLWKWLFSFLPDPEATAFWRFLRPSQTFHHCLSISFVLFYFMMIWITKKKKKKARWSTNDLLSVHSVHFTASSSPHLLFKLALSFSHHTFFKPLSGFALNSTLVLAHTMMEFQEVVGVERANEGQFV